MARASVAFFGLTFNFARNIRRRDLPQSSESESFEVCSSHRESEIEPFCLLSSKQFCDWMHGSHDFLLRDRIVLFMCNVQFHWEPQFIVAEASRDAAKLGRAVLGPALLRR